jgi:hypothetical protein
MIKLLMKVIREKCNTKCYSYTPAFDALGILTMWWIHEICWEVCLGGSRR